MKSTSFNRNPLRVAIAAVALSAMSGIAQADPVSLTLQYGCPFPLIGSQPISADISSDMPASIAVGQPTGAFELSALTTVNENSRTGLKLVGSQTIGGTANASSNIALPGINLPLTVPLTIEQTPIPGTPGDFTVLAEGSTPSLTFTEANVGEAVITVGNLVLEMVALLADGSQAPAPIGQFTSPCTLTAGQNTVLHSFQITPVDGDDEADINVNPTAVDFGMVQAGLSATQTVTVANIGGLPLGVNNVTISGGNGAFTQSNNCATVAAGANCQVTVTYFASGNGAQGATLVIESDDADESSVSVQLSGVSAEEQLPQISVDSQSINFGTVALGATADRAITVTNTGMAGLNIAAIGIAGANSGDFTQSHNCSTIAPNASCTINVTFSTGQAGARNAQLTIESDDAANPSLTVALTGTGNDGSAGMLDIAMDIEGFSFIKRSKTELPITGGIDARLELATGMFTADLNLEPTLAPIAVIKNLLNSKATVEFEQIGETTGTFINGVLNSESTMYIKVPKVTVKMFGFDVRIGGGENCRTVEPVTINLQTPEGEQFSPATGGNLMGTYTLPQLENCGALNSVITQFMVGTGNTIGLVLTP